MIKTHTNPHLSWKIFMRADVLQLKHCTFHLVHKVVHSESLKYTTLCVFFIENSNCVKMESSPYLYFNLNGLQTYANTSGYGLLEVFRLPKIHAQTHPSRGYLVLGRIHMLDLGLGRPTHSCTKISCSNPPSYQFSLSNPSMYQKFMLKTLQFKTHPSTKIHLCFGK